MALSQMKRQTIINEYGEHGIVKTSKDKESFLNSIIKGYHKLIDNKVDRSFYKYFQMYGNLSARYFISNYDESILYIYPSNKKTLRIDYLDKPAQVLLSHGLIDLNNPESAILSPPIKEPAKIIVYNPARAIKGRTYASCVVLKNTQIPFELLRKKLVEASTIK